MKEKTPAILIFPIDMYQSRQFERTVARLGIRLVCASSEISTVRRGSPSISYLPYVTDECFESSFLSLVALETITMVYAPHQAIWWKLHQLIERHSLNLTICSENPFEMDCYSFRMATAWAKRCASMPSIEIAGKRKPLEERLYANLYQGFSIIPGQSDDEKIQLLAWIMANAPDGDVVEIGSAYGRSAFSLAFLAQKHQIGPMLCIDPWRISSINDQGESAKLLNESGHHGNLEEIFQSFIVTMAAFDHVNFIREPSADAIDIYTRAAQGDGVNSVEFGRTKISGSISVLHIDGNHAFEEVSTDVKIWGDQVKAGGWILIDDYVWAFGNGPQRAGDYFLAHQKYSTAFCSGDTLCINV